MTEKEYRTGIGHDTHRVTEGTAVRLGGISVPWTHGLLGHSDADVLLHAVTDALLGAAGLGDIGDMFPDTDPANKGRDSGEMLSLAWERVRKSQWRLVNLDAIIFAEAPKLGPYKTKIKERIAALLNVEADRINIKAKTGEKIGIIGRGEAISAEVIVLIVKD